MLAYNGDCVYCVYCRLYNATRCEKTVPDSHLIIMGNV